MRKTCSLLTLSANHVLSKNITRVKYIPSNKLQGKPTLSSVGRASAYESRGHCFKSHSSKFIFVPTQTKKKLEHRVAP